MRHLLRPIRAFTTPAGVTLLAGCLLVASSRPLAAQDHPGYSPAEVAAFHERWTNLNWDDGGDLSRYVYLHTTEFWPHAVIDAWGTARELPEAPRADVASFPVRTEAGSLPLEEYLEASPAADGMVVVHEGRIVFEAYPRMAPWDKHTLMSVAKPFTSALIAILEDEGKIDTRAPVDAYLPELAGSGWEGVPVRDVLDMASGIDCRQSVAGAYSDPGLCYYQYEAALGWLAPTEQTPGDVREHVFGLDAHRPSGEAFEYTSVNTSLLAWLAEAVTGRRFTDLVEGRIWGPMGAEADGVVTTNEGGVPAVHAGISATLRDVARFGLLFTPSGRSGPEAVVTDAHLRKIQREGRPEIFDAARPDRPTLVDGEAPVHNSWQWDWVMADGDFYKGGYGGQGLYVSPARDLVVAFFGTTATDGTSHELARVARRLATSGIF